MNIAKFLRTSILKNIFEQLLLKVAHCFNFLMNKVPIRSGTFYRSCSVSCKCVRRLRMLCNRRLYQINKCRPSQITCTVRRYTCTKLRARYWFLCVKLIWIYQCVTFFCPVLGWLLPFMMISCLLPHCHCTKKWSFPFRISSVNVTKCAGNRIWSHLLKNSLMENLIFCAVCADFFVCLFLQKSIL